MARNREFDEDEVLNAALQTFRRKGYEGTTLPDLLQATGLARQSLYNAFGDKRELFLESLRRYAETEHGRMAKTLEGSPLRAALADIFDNVLHGADRDCGCFLVNAASELLPRDPEVGRIVASAMARQETTLAAALRRAVRNGEVRLPARRVEQTARFLVGVLQGLVVMAKAMPGSPAARDTAAVALRAIE